MTNFQRVGASSNARLGVDFEQLATMSLRVAGLRVQPRFSVPVGVGELKKKRVFDFGCVEPPVLSSASVTAGQQEATHRVRN